VPRHDHRDHDDRDDDQLGLLREQHGGVPRHGEYDDADGGAAIVGNVDAREYDHHTGDFNARHDYNASVAADDNNSGAYEHDS